MLFTMARQASCRLHMTRILHLRRWAGVNAGQIVQRIMKSRDMYEERQRVKGVKGIGEEAQRTREKLEAEQKLKEERAAS